jgi:hypothetical protein
MFKKYNGKDRGLLKKSLISVAVLAFLFAGALAYVIIQMPWMNWDNTEEDVNTTMPGDNLTPDTNWVYTHAITINASADKVWPWVNQIGSDRGGFYSYELLENLAGCGLHNAESIHPQWQYKGDGTEKLIMHPKAPPLPVEKVIPQIALIMHAGTFDKYGINPKVMPKDYINMTWSFYLQKLDWNKTRLLVRWRAVYYPSKDNEMWYGPRLTGFMNFIMGDAMIRGIKQRAER